jgi:hypothetical protein
MIKQTYSEHVKSIYCILLLPETFAHFLFAILREKRYNYYNN